MYHDTWSLFGLIIAKNSDTVRSHRGTNSSDPKTYAEQAHIMSFSLSISSCASRNIYVKANKC